VSLSRCKGSLGTYLGVIVVASHGSEELLAGSWRLGDDLVLDEPVPDVAVAPGRVDGIGSRSIGALHLGQHFITRDLSFGSDDTFLFEVSAELVVGPCRINVVFGVIQGVTDCSGSSSSGRGD